MVSIRRKSNLNPVKNSGFSNLGKITPAKAKLKPDTMWISGSFLRN